MHLKNHVRRVLFEVNLRTAMILQLDCDETGFSESQFHTLVVSLWKLRVVMWMKNVKDLIKK